MEPLLHALPVRKLLGALKCAGGKIIAQKTLATLVSREGLPCHLDPFGSGRRVYLESEIRAWWEGKLVARQRPIPPSGRPRKVR